MKKARVGASIVAIFGVVVTGLTQLWWLISEWQQIEQLVQDGPRIVKWLGHPLAGPSIAALAVLAFGIIVLFERSHPPSSMVGKFFHTINGAGEIQYQGYVLRDEGGHYFAQFLSFNDGYPSTQRYLTLAEVQNLRLYDTNQQMNDAYYRAYPELDRGLAEFATAPLDDED